MQRRTFPMAQRTPPGIQHGRVSVLRLIPLLLPLVLVVGCAGHDDGDDNGGATPTLVASTATPTRSAAITSTPTVSGDTRTPTRPAPATPTPTVGDLALPACQKLAECGQCFLNERGACLDPSQCAARITEDEARCINSTAGCGQAALGDCLTVGCGGDGSGECE
jgi:hypothetical protein